MWAGQQLHTKTSSDLFFGWCFGWSRVSEVEATGEPDLGVLGGERVYPVHKQRGRAVKSVLLGVVGGFNQLVLEFGLQCVGGDHRLHPFVGDLPIGAGVEVLEGDFHGVFLSLGGYRGFDDVTDADGRPVVRQVFGFLLQRSEFTLESSQILDAGLDSCRLSRDRGPDSSTRCFAVPSQRHDFPYIRKWELQRSQPSHKTQQINVLARITPIPRLSSSRDWDYVQ